MAQSWVMMARRWITTGLCASALAVSFATVAHAEAKRALVVVDRPDAADQAIAISETLLGLGFDVARLESPTPQALDDALQTLTVEGGPTAIYFAGDLGDLTDFTGAGGETPRFIFVDACQEVAVDALPSNVFLVSPGADCAGDVAAVVQEWLTVPGLSTDQWDLGETVQISSTLTAPYVFRETTSEVRLTAEDYALLDSLSPEARAQMIRLWRSAGIAVDVADATALAPVAPVQVARDTVQVIAPVSAAAASTVVRPIAPVPVSGGVTQPARAGSTSRTLSPTINLPTPGAAGLPAPSILVGFVTDSLPEAPEVPDEPVAGAAFGTDDVAAREALREQDADLFAGLVSSGAFDPTDDVIRALQVELARINCYTSGIDGAWGPGSQRALAAFYDLSGTNPSDATPDLEDFRTVIAANGVRCPDPAPQPTRQAATSSQSTAQPARAAAPAASQPRRATPAPAPAPAPAAPSAPRRSINQTGGSGIFR